MKAYTVWPAQINKINVGATYLHYARNCPVVGDVVKITRVGQHALEFEEEGTLRCAKHPKYKAVKYPPSECYYCVQLWQLKQSIKRGCIVQATKFGK